MPRTFNLETRLKANARSGILDIPHMGLLRHKSPREFIAEFKRTWNVDSLDGVVLPVTSNDGLLFPVAGLDYELSPYARVSDHLKDFQSVVKSFADEGLGIYLLLSLHITFIHTSSLHVENIIGTGSPVLCIGNARGQDVMAAILGTAIDLVNDTAEGRLKGVVLDVVDVWGMGGKNERLHLTCFCPSCRRFFETKHRGLLQHFRDFPNPWNLLLQVSDTGINYVDDIHSEMRDEDIIGLSRQRGFSEVFEEHSTNKLSSQADLLREYVRIRHDQTLDAIGKILSQSLEGLEGPPPTRILLVEGVNYGWTSGLQLDRLDKVPAPSGLDEGQRDGELQPYDEIWFDPSSSDLFLKHVPFRSYMWARSRYFIDAFFSFAAEVSNPVLRATTQIARLPPTVLKSLLRSRLQQALGTAMTSRTSLASLPDLESNQTEARPGVQGESKRIGFVGVGLDRALGEKFVEFIDISPGLSREAEDDLDAQDI